MELRGKICRRIWCIGTIPGVPEVIDTARAPQCPRCFPKLVDRPASLPPLAVLGQVSFGYQPTLEPILT